MSRLMCPAGWALLRHFEQGPDGGPALEAYPDEGGAWTIGFGHTRGVKEGDRCTPGMAETWLAQDAASAEYAVDSKTKVLLNEHQFGALVCFTFNVGVGDFMGSTLLQLLNAGGYGSVPTQLARWNKCRGVTSLGLTRRRAAEIALWNTPIPPSGVPAGGFAGIT